jgi:hypothetical protein
LHKPVVQPIVYELPRVIRKMNIKLGDDTEERFRKAASNSKGMKKGNISIAIEEAIDLWIEEQKRKERK